jgi:hypothetical protein
MDSANTSINNEEANANSKHPNEPKTGGGGGGIKDFIAQTSLIGNVIAAAAAHKNSFEPLPFPNYSLFDENHGKC